MCDTQMHFDNSNNSGRDRMLIEDQRMASLKYLAFWSNPAWFRTTKHSSLTDSAIKEWVAYNRLSVAINKETMVQIIRSVKEVTPNSRLAKYGDYSYDIDYEDMCCIDEDSNSKSNILKAEKFAYPRRYDFWGSKTERNISGTRENYMYSPSTRNSTADHRIRSLNEWLKELNQVLIKVKQIANKAQLLDSWTETLLKFCLRFVCILRNNENLVELLNSEISFIIDYEELRKMPTSKIELQSIPQPENSGNNFSFYNESVDDLWLQLSSPSIRNIWRKEMKLPFPLDNKNQHLAPLIKINFLRSRRPKISCFSRKTTDFSIQIPKNMETELLGSLLNIINGNKDNAFIKMNDAVKDYFPEAHGEWTKHLFPHRTNLNSKFGKNSAIWKPRNAAPSISESNTKVKLESRSTEIAALPVQYYKPVPQPTLAARFRLPYIDCQPRNRVVVLPSNNFNFNPPNQQVQYKFPTVPVSNVLPAAYVSQTPFPKYCNCNIRQRMPAPTVNVTGQYHRLNILRARYQYSNSEGTKEPQKYPSKINDNSSAEKIFIENEAKNLKHEYNNNEIVPLSDIPLSPTAPFVQLSHGYNIPFRIQQNAENVNKTSQSIVPNSQLQVRESRIPLKMNYPIASVRLQTPLIKMTSPPSNHYILPQFTTKPRFLGPVTVNGIKRIQERLCHQRYLHDYKNNPSYQDSIRNTSFKNISSHSNDISEDKVEKWLESVNKYLKSGSNINLEELPEFPRVELSEISNIDLLELPKVESTEVSSVKFDELSSVELSEPATVELPEVSTVELEELSIIELPKHSEVELSELSNIKLSEHPIIEISDTDNKSYDGGKDDGEESGNSQNENTFETPELKKSCKINLPSDHIKSNLNILSNNIVEKSHESKANILKHKKLKARREFFERLQQLPDIVPKLKSCKNLRRKKKILKKYFPAINSISTERFPFENFIKILGKKNQFTKKIRQTKNKEFSVGMKFDKQLSTESNFDMRQSNLLINDSSKYMIWIRESQEFNAFPSKRVKLSKSQIPFLETKTLIRDKQEQWISSLKYFDSTIDELFFADNGIEKILNRNRNRTMDAETNGWTHFKVAVKTIMKRIISSLNVQISSSS